MSRRSKRLRYAAARQAPALAQPAALFSGYDGANYSPMRGDVWMPTLETKEELDGYSRTELLRKIRWLYINVGLFKAFVNSAADLIGWQTPQAETGNPAFDKEAYLRFEDRAGTAAAFDVAGKFNFWDAQPMLSRCALKDGELLTVLTSSATGSAMFAFYEAHQLATPKNGKERWHDGILLDSHGRHLSYGLRSSSDKTVIPISARDVIYHGEFDSPGYVRPTPRLAHAVTTGLDITEIRALVKGSIKSTALFGAVRESSNPAIPRSQRGITGAPGYEVRTRAGNTAAGEAATVTEKFEVSHVWGGNQIPRLPTGEELKILHDSRPSPNQMDFMEVLARDMSVGFGLPLEVIWQMSGLTGPGVRFVMDVADRWIKARQSLLENWCRSVWVYTIAKEIKAKRLKVPAGKGGEVFPWWRVRFVPQRNLTIDRGRDMKSRMEAVAAGFETEDNFCEEFYGTTAGEVRRKHVEGVAEKMAICAELGVPYEVAYPPKAGTAVAEKQEARDQKPEEEEEP